MGFGDVFCADMLAHLRAMYGTIRQAELEANQMRLALEWSVNSPIENLWLRIHEIQHALFRRLMRQRYERRYKDCFGKIMS
jgi:hypothetical protein